MPSAAEDCRSFINIVRRTTNQAVNIASVKKTPSVLRSLTTKLQEISILSSQIYDCIMV